MTDEHLTSLFAEGTAPERDAEFARHVGARIASARRGPRLVALAIRTMVILTLAAATVVTARVLEPMLEPIAGGSSPHFMGVPLPLVLGALAVGLAVHLRRFVGLRLR
jgi:hypothetical protein